MGEQGVSRNNRILINVYYEYEKNLEVNCYF